ncbi:COX15/CtaA family protein [Flindersiella endophytica]
MKTVYKVLAYLVAAEVMVQAMLMVFAIAGLGIWVDSGGVFDKSVMESEGSPFPEVVGFMLHGMNGMMVIPALALILLIISFFTRLPGAVKWAAVVLLLVITQILLGMFGHVFAALGALHGLNALLLFSAAVYTARRVRKADREPAVEAEQRLATSA